MFDTYHSITVLFEISRVDWKNQNQFSMLIICMLTKRSPRRQIDSSLIYKAVDLLTSFTSRMASKREKTADMNGGHYESQNVTPAKRQKKQDLPDGDDYTVWNCQQICQLLKANKFEEAAAKFEGKKC